MIPLLLALAGNVILETDVPATMRDGVDLRADILRPDAPGRFPAILLRTPYGKAYEWRDSFSIRAARAGYVVVAQDVRGRYASDGVFHPYHQEGKDGFDTVEWVASLPYVNGKVGMAGLSYPGAVQWLAAMEKPPHLATITPLMCFSNARHFFFNGGAWDLSWISWFYLNIAPDVRARSGLPGPKTDVEAEELWGRHREEWLSFLPLSELPILRDVAPTYYDWLAHPEDGPYWDFANVEARYGEIAIPALALSGHHCVPIAMVTHEYFIRCAVHKNSVRIGQPRRRTLDISPGLLIFFESPRKNINAVDMLRGGIDFVILQIQKDPSARPGRNPIQLSAGSGIAGGF